MGKNKAWAPTLPRIIYVSCFDLSHACLIVSANWRLENAKSPAAILQENNPQTPHAWVYRVCTWYLVAFAMLIYVVCLEARDYTELLVSLGWRIGTETDWVCWTSACWMSMGGANTTVPSFEKAWNMWLKWQQKDGCFVSRQTHRYSH